MKDVFWGPQGSMSFVSLISKIDAEVERINGYLQRLYGASQDENGNGTIDPLISARVLYTQLSPLINLLDQFYAQIPGAGMEFNRQQVESLFVDDENGVMPSENIERAVTYMSGMASSADMDLVNSAYQNQQRNKNLPKGKPRGPGPSSPKTPPAGLAPGTGGTGGTMSEPINV